jgi:membrane-associated protease RseP (regulator of RpoE activity)
VLGIIVSVALHELGHFIPAKLFGVPATEYFVGFGPKLFSKRRGETEYGVKAILLGGYTRIEGMFPPKPAGRVDKHFKAQIEAAREESEKGMQGFDEKRAFYNLSSPKKLTVMMGGTLTNLVLGFVCFLIAFSLIGARVPSLEIAAVAPESPAAVAGIEVGDRIEAVNDEAVENWGAAQAKIANSTGSVTLELQNDAEHETKTVQIEPSGEQGSRKIGIQAGLETRRLGVLETVQLTLENSLATVNAITMIPVELFNTTLQLVTGDTGSKRNLMSVIGLGQVAVAADNNTVDLWAKVGNILSILGSLNIALFVFNLVPLLPLDGGHSANAIYEGLKRSWFKLRKKPRPAPSDLARSMPVANVVFVLLIFMFVIMAVADLVHPLV